MYLIIKQNSQYSTDPISNTGLFLLPLIPITYYLNCIQLEYENYLPPLQSAFSPYFIYSDKYSAEGIITGRNK